jgi:type IV pilus assembly protein PilC
MLFKYKIVDNSGNTKEGNIEAVGKDVAINTLQKKGYLVVTIDPVSEKKGVLQSISIGKKRIPLKDVVIMSRQFATLFQAQVPAVRVFTLMENNIENKYLSEIIASITEDIKGGMTISQAMKKHPDAFSRFYVNMVASGEESGKLTETFNFLADYLERNYELTSKTKHALVYPAFVIITFFIVMVLMLTMVIPKLGKVIIDSGQEIPAYTQFVLWLSDFTLAYGIYVGLALVFGGIIAFRYIQGQAGKGKWDAYKLRMPYFGMLFNKIYLSRISDNLSTMLGSGIPIVRALEITSSVVDNQVYKDIIDNGTEAVKSGRMLSESFGQFEEMPQILVQMIRVGEETGSISNILKTLAAFYRKEVEDTVDTLIGMIEPAMIIVLGVGVGFLLTAILMPIYNMTSAF